jgi:hypothetical protein
VAHRRGGRLHRHLASRRRLTPHPPPAPPPAPPPGPPPADLGLMSAICPIWLATNPRSARRQPCVPPRRPEPVEPRRTGRRRAHLRLRAGSARDRRTPISRRSWTYLGDLPDMERDKSKIGAAADRHAGPNGSSLAAPDDPAHLRLRAGSARPARTSAPLRPRPGAGHGLPATAASPLGRRPRPPRPATASGPPGPGPVHRARPGPPGPGPVHGARPGPRGRAGPCPGHRARPQPPGPSALGPVRTPGTSPVGTSASTPASAMPLRQLTVGVYGDTRHCSGACSNAAPD